MSLILLISITAAGLIQPRTFRDVFFGDFGLADRFLCWAAVKWQETPPPNSEQSNTLYKFAVRNTIYSQKKTMN